MRRLSPAVAVLAAVGCVTIDQGRRMEEDIARLELQVTDQAATQAIQKQVLDDAVERIDQKIKDVAVATEFLGLTARKTDAGFGVSLDEMVHQLQLVRGDLEELKFKLESVETNVGQSSEDTARRLAALKSDAALDAYEARKKAKALARSGNKDELLRLAREHLDEGQHEGARTVASDFLERWPDDALAGDAQFIVAQTYYAQKDWRPSILEYNKFRERYPEHVRAPDALLAIGESFVAIGLKPEAGKFFDALIKRYPKHAVAQQAKKRRKELGI